jgi:hypothetical protein
MLKIILENPYRLIGVCANAPVKERVANNNRLKAYLKVGKSITFPLDLPTLISPVDRTIEGLTSANSNINLSKDQLKFSLFWFVNNSTIDSMALEYLQKGNAEKAAELFSKKENFSAQPINPVGIV